MNRFLAFTLGILFCFQACVPAQNKSNHAQILEATKQRKLTPEESQALLQDMGNNWLYGNGLGEALLTTGTVIVFPPYALYVLGNALLGLNGYEELRVSNLLPEGGREDWNEMYETLTSGPGRFAAAVAGEEYRNRELVKETVKKHLAAPSI